MNTGRISNQQFFLYNSEDGKIRLEVHLKDETLWLSMNELAILFGVNKSGVSRHLKSIFETGELNRDSVVAIFATTAADGKNYRVDYYNLDAIISVGYRVNSIRGTQFRMWATQRLKEYIVKGFSMDDERLKNGESSRYFEELLARIRDVRSSEKLFYQKVLDIYATSVDYDSHATDSRLFFKTVQNKLHWGAHGHTASQLIYRRADAAKQNMGLTNWPGNKITKRDAEVAKNYLTSQELEYLNRVVTAYLEFAELQAMSYLPMSMQDWIKKLDDFLLLSGRSTLTDSGGISHSLAIDKAHREYEKYKQEQLNAPASVELDYREAILELKTMEKKVKESSHRRSVKKKPGSAR